jgi:hypothetical protein
MPLLDHFHPPLSAQRHWESFHARWASAIADELNRQLPPHYFAEPQAHSGPQVEVDVATFEQPHPTTTNGVATLSAPAFTLAPADGQFALAFPPRFGVQVYQTEGGPELVGAIELVSPSNKDRPEPRQAFAVKCANYLHHGIGLLVVDVVTARTSQPLHDLLRLLAPDVPVPATSALAAVAYRPLPQLGVGTVEWRIRPLRIGHALPELPLTLAAGPVVPVNLAVSYEEARARLRL